ncbi:UNVERIFIED_CONTAM: hypothetical protein FKN15_022426 [Acipenser sinensis]
MHLKGGVGWKKCLSEMTEFTKWVSKSRIKNYIKNTSCQNYDFYTRDVTMAGIIK